MNAGDSEPAEPWPPIIPPMWFAGRFDPPRSPLDPLVTMAWHLATERDREHPPIGLPEI